jgi:hypothetical protein
MNKPTLTTTNSSTAANPGFFDRSFACEPIGDDRFGGIRRLQRSGRVAFASQLLGGDLARPLTDRRLDTPSGIPLEAQL